MTTLRETAKKAAYGLTDRWPEYSRLMPMWDIHSWVISWEIRELVAIARRLSVRTLNPRWRGFCRSQAIFYGSQFFLMSDDWLSLPHRVATAYFHGKPGAGIGEFDALYEKLRCHHENLSRVQVSHSEMHDVVLEAGIDPQKVFRIPIGVNLDFFPLQTPASAKAARRKYNIPESAAVVGSFQKDGVGWGDGSEPKLMKGPDVFLKVVARLKETVPELFVVLTGPARGYVKKGLEDLNVPYRHCPLQRYPDIGEVYRTLDLYLVTSRHEGGPKAVLEAMACGVPLVTTRVGQAMDLVRHAENGFMTNIDDVEGLRHWAEQALTRSRDLSPVVRAGRQTAEANSYTAQSPLWRGFFEGFVQTGA